MHILDLTQPNLTEPFGATTRRINTSCGQCAYSETIVPAKYEQLISQSLSFKNWQNKSGKENL